MTNLFGERFFDKINVLYSYVLGLAAPLAPEMSMACLVC